MCIISNPIVSVSQTKILVGPNKSLDRQITVYSNEVNNISNSNAMILPVPHPSTVEFIDLTNYKNLFTDLDSVFYTTTSNFTRGGSNLSYGLNSAQLKVFNVGSYKVSLAMNLADLNRVDNSVFYLSPDCFQLLNSTYDSTYGFIICKLNMGSEQYHPFAYSHKMIKPGQLFIPTKHYHDHTSYIGRLSFDRELNKFGYNPNDIDNSPMFSLTGKISQNKQEADDWSHDIYLYNSTSEEIKQMSKKHKYRYVWNGKNPFVETSNKINFEFDSLSHFEKHKIEGTHSNIDLIVNYTKKDLVKNPLTNKSSLNLWIESY